MRSWMVTRFFGKRKYSIRTSNHKTFWSRTEHTRLQISGFLYFTKEWSWIACVKEPVNTCHCKSWLSQTTLPAQKVTYFPLESYFSRWSRVVIHSFCKSTKTISNTLNFLEVHSLMFPPTLSPVYQCPCNISSNWSLKWLPKVKGTGLTLMKSTVLWSRKLLCLEL
jgi:hypothetical protein